MALNVTAVIPTLNRPEDLMNAIVSIIEQKRLPDELIVVDQSEGDDSYVRVKRIFEDFEEIRLVYIHDTNISGLVEAKKVATEKASGNIICFLEDDVILEPEYIEQVELGFVRDDSMLGCSGIITNQPHQSAVYRKAHGIFFQGIFKDPRAQIFGGSHDIPNDLILCDVLSGGLSSWRKKTLSNVPFDVDNGFFMLEDIEYSTRVVKEYGHKLYVNPNVRLEHHYSPVNRDPHGNRQRRKLTEAITFYKKRRDWSGAKRGLVFAMIWWFAEATYQAIRNYSIGPVLGYWQGVIDGVKKMVVK